MRGRFTRRLQFQLAYTLSKTMDDVSDAFDLAGAFVLPQNSLTFAGEYAPANFDARHRFAYNYIYELPALTHHNRLVRALFGNLQLAGLGSFQTGPPFTVNSTLDITHHNRLVRALFGNLQLAGLGSFQTGPLFTVNSTLDITHPNRLVRALFGNLQLAGLGSFQTGPPFT